MYVKDYMALKSISHIALLATLLPLILVFAGTIEMETHKWIMLIGMLVLFLSAPFSIKKKREC
jgi:hypothetical protein